MKKIMIADDDASILTLLSYHFKADGFEVTTAKDGNQALKLGVSDDFDMILLDLMMPGFDGIALTEKLRSRGIYTPILILTAREDDVMKLKGLKAGSDDYLDKTTPVPEILVRAQTLIRRHQQYSQPVNGQFPTKNQDVLSFGPLTLDKKSKTATFKQSPLNLTKREFELLELLINKNGDVVSREDLLQHFWGISDAAETRTIDVLISKIRKKLDNQYIKTKRGFGYYFEATSEK